VSVVRRGLWVLGILALLFAPARWAEAGHDGRDALTIGASVLAPTFSSAELPRVEHVHGDDAHPDTRGQSAEPTTAFLVVALVAVAAGLARRHSAVVDRDSVLAAPWRWRGPPLPFQLT
jgi:uncharacterized protein (TIGR03382 family)